MSRLARGWAWAGLILLAAVAIGLATAAVLANRGAPDATATPIPPDSFAPAPSTAPIPSATETAATETPLALAVRGRLITGADATNGFRVATTACPADGPVVVQSTADGGRTWRDHAVKGASGVLALDAYESAKLLGAIVGTGSDCARETWRSFTGAVSWAVQPSAAFDAAVVDPGDPARILRDGSPVDTPCAGIDAAAIGGDGGTAALCADASLRLSPKDHPASWAEADLPGSAVAVTRADGGYLVALRRDPACAGLELATLRGTDAVVPVACLAGDTDESEPVTLGTADDGAFWIWAGDAVGVSIDGGATWKGLE